MTTIIFVDAYNSWPVETVGRLDGYPSNESFTLDGDGIPSWASGLTINPHALAWGVSFSNSLPMEDTNYVISIVRDYNGLVRQFGNTNEAQHQSIVVESYNLQPPPRFNCWDCSNTWTIGSDTNGPDETRPVYRECCSRFVCEACHHRASLRPWRCYACDALHCDSIIAYICQHDGVVSCMESHCYDDEYDAWDSENRPFLTRGVNTAVRLGGVSHEKARGARFVGVEIEAEGGDGGTLHDDIPRYCGITTDGSLDVGGVEIQTPPARGAKFVEIIEQTTNALKSSGWDVSSRCGLHVHIDMGDKVTDGEFLGRMYAAFFAIEPLLFRLQGGRRDNNSYCSPLKEAYGNKGSIMRRKSAKRIMADWHHLRRFRHETKEEFDQRVEAIARDKYHETRYRATNFHSIGCHGTLEIRLHEGTLDADTILAWTDLLQSVVRACELDRWPGGQRLRYADNPVKAQRMFRFTRKTREYIVKRLNAEAMALSGKTYAVTAGSLVEAGRSF